MSISAISSSAALQAQTAAFILEARVQVAWKTIVLLRQAQSVILYINRMSEYSKMGLSYTRQ